MTYFQRICGNVRHLMAIMNRGTKKNHYFKYFLLPKWVMPHIRFTYDKLESYFAPHKEIIYWAMGIFMDKLWNIIIIGNEI